MDLSSFTKKSGKTYQMAETKKCIQCGKEIYKDSTPRHLFYAGFCSEQHKEQYVRR